MKVFLSADMEGTCGVSSWRRCRNVSASSSSASVRPPPLQPPAVAVATDVDPPAVLGEILARLRTLG